MVKIGMLILLLGISMADSKCLVIPVMFVLLGSILVWRGSHE